MFKELLLTLSLILLLTGCINDDGYTRSNEGLSWTVDSGSDGTPDYISKKDIPEGAIKVEDDLYYVPIEKDNRGCMMYRSYSVHNATYAVIMYRDVSGKFPSNSRLTNCQ